MSMKEVDFGGREPMTKLEAEYQRIREAMGVPDDYDVQESDLAMALRHEARTGELPEFSGKR